MATENNCKKLIELSHKREKLEGTKIIRRIKCLASSQYILNRNFQEMLNAINYYEHDSSIWTIVNRLKLDKFQREFLRLLHNYLASRSSLMDHTRAFYRNLSNQEFDKYYEKEKEKLKLNKCVIFLQDLKNYTLHYQLPFLSATSSFTVTNPEKGEGAYDQKLVLNKEELLEWKVDNTSKGGWSSDSKDYLSKFQKEIDLKVVVEEYQMLISQFYDKFYKKIAELYSKQIEELKQIEIEMSKIQ